MLYADALIAQVKLALTTICVTCIRFLLAAERHVEDAKGKEVRNEEHAWTVRDILQWVNSCSMQCMGTSSSNSDFLYY